FASAVIVVGSLLLFMYDFPSKHRFGSKYALRVHGAITVITSFIIFTPYFIESVGDESIRMGLLYPYFLAYIVYSLALFWIVASRQIAGAKSRDHKRQALLVYGGVVVYAALTIISNLIIPLFSGNWSSSRLGPVFSLIFVSAVAYSIFKYRLFDIKWLIIRSAGFVLSLLALVIVSFVSLTWLSAIFTELEVSSIVQVNVLVFITILLSVVYQPFKSFFIKMTNRLFYKDAYDTRALLDEFNRVIASTIVFDDMLGLASMTIEKYLKPQSVAFVIRDGKDSLKIKPNGTKLSAELISHVDDYMRSEESGLLMVDILDEGQPLKQLMQHANTSAIVRMAVNKGSAISYLILGYKKNGESYDYQDREALRILSNVLSVAVQNALRFQEIESFNITLQQKIDDATRHLRHSNAKLRMLDETKDDFISMASHQLRTPLTSVKGYVSMVLDGDAGKLNSLQRKLLNQAFVSSQRMVYLISDLLNVSRLRTGKFVIETAPINLANIIREEAEQLKETAQARDLAMVYVKPEHFPLYMLDETKMRQVIMNFMDNAIYYTPSGGKIQIALVDRPTTIEFTVTDSGIGVPKADQPHLFTKFFRAHNARRARPDGTGLGLFMAKKVIIAQGGAIIFRSREGKGSTFGFSFAKDKLQQTPPPTEK
ncbi:MAG TPA: ATP-binding protein, partial [Candidatus Saccharimonadales bacterium]